MAKFNKGESMKAQRVYISAAFDQKGNSTGKSVVATRANDDKTPETADTQPVLVYDSYKDKDNKMQPSYTKGYSAKEWERIEKMANKEGDALVVIADLFPPKGRDGKREKGLKMNTLTLQTPDVPFDKAKHVEVTQTARDNKKAAREAKANVEPAPEAEDELQV